MKTSLLLPLLLVLSLAPLRAQTQPEVRPDTTVRFTLSAPGAAEVELDGTMIPPRFKIDAGLAAIGGKTRREMAHVGDKWTFSTAPLAPGLYTYTFLVDGRRIPDPQNPRTVRDIADTLSYFIIPGGVGTYYLDEDIPHGTLQHVWYPSRMQRWERRRMSIYTPPGYDPAGAYPVLYLLHGSGGDEDAWAAMGRVCQILDHAIARGEAEPMIVVMPNGNVELDAAPGAGADPSVQPNGVNVASMLGEVETVFVDDVVAFVDANFATRPERHARAIAGLSMGGLHTLFTAVNHPEVFAYVGLFSAQTTNGMQERRIRRLQRLKERISRTIESAPLISDELRGRTIARLGDSYNVDFLDVYADFDGKLKALFDARPSLFYVAIGRDDFLKKINDDLRATLTSGHYPFVYVETDGGHTWDNWRRYLIDFLPRLFKQNP